MNCRCGYPAHRTETPTAGGHREIWVTCATCFRGEYELRSRNGALIRWKMFVVQPNAVGTGGNADESAKGFGGMETAADGADSEKGDGGEEAPSSAIGCVSPAAPANPAASANRQEVAE